MAKDENKRYAALEISSRAVRLVYGYFQDDRVHVLHALETNVSALDGGLVVEHETLTAAIKGIINAANEMLHIKIKEVILALPPMGLVFCRESSTTTTIGMDNVIVQIDVNNAISQLRKFKFSDGLKIVDVVPYQYILDNKEYSPEPPLGKTSSSLTIHGSIFALEESLVNGYVKACENASLRVRHVVVSPYASSLYMTNCEEVPTSYYLLNFGSEITTLTQISQNNLIYQNACFKFGSERITQCLQDKFDLNAKEAKALKEKYGIDKNPSFKVNVYKNLTLEDIGSTIAEALDPLIGAIKKQVSTWSSADHRYLPIVITGGGSKLYGFKNLLEKKLELQVVDFTPYSFGARDKTYQNCLGLIMYAGKHINDDEIDELSSSVISRVAPKNPGKKNINQYDFDEEL